MTDNEQIPANSAIKDAESPSGRGAVYAALVGLPAGILLGWTLLSWALSLPFLLGVFFFMLFGLFIGAGMFRAASKSAPLSKSSVVVATALVTLVCWATALLKECRDFPADFVKGAVKRVYIPRGKTEAVRAELATFIDARLAEKYPPGGVLGYLQLAATGQPIVIDDLPTRQPQPVVIPARASSFTWWTRTLLSLVLMYVAIYSVTGGLLPSSKRGAIDDESIESGATGKDDSAPTSADSSSDDQSSPVSRPIQRYDAATVATEQTR